MDITTTTNTNTTTNTSTLTAINSLPLLTPRGKKNCGCACAGNTGNVFPATVGKRSRHASRHVRDARAVMHTGIAN